MFEPFEDGFCGLAEAAFVGGGDIDRVLLNDNGFVSLLIVGAWGADGSEADEDGVTVFLIQESSLLSSASDTAGVLSMDESFSRLRFRSPFSRPTDAAAVVTGDVSIADGLTLRSCE